MPAGDVGFMTRSVAWFARYAIASVGVIAAVLGYSSVLPNVVLAVAACVMAAALCAYFSKNRLLLLIAAVLLYSVYSIAFVNYISPLTTTMFTTYRGSAAAGVALSSLLLFLSCLLLFAPASVSHFGKNDSLFHGSTGNTFLVVALCVVLALILVFTFGRPDTIGGDRGSPSALYEYSTIFFLIGFYLAGDKRGLRVTLVALAILFALQNMVYGGRITALQLIIILFFVFYSERISSFRLVVLAVCVLMIFTFIGVVRTSITSAGFDEFLNIMGNAITGGFTWDTAYSSWHTSITFVLYSDFVSWEERLLLLWQWIQSIALGGSVPMCNLSVITRSYFSHWFGGVFPVYFYFYLGPLGVVLSAGYVSIVLRFVNGVCERCKDSNGGVIEAASVISAVYVSVSCFRWILYSPSQITRGLLLCFVCALFLLWFNRQMMQRNLKDTGRNSSRKFQSHG